MKELLNAANDDNNNKNQNVNDILGCVTFNIVELSRLPELYQLAEERGILNFSNDALLNKFQEAMQDVSKLPHYLFTVHELLGDEQFKTFFLFYQQALLCADSDEKTKVLFQVIRAFRSLCNTNDHMYKHETLFYLKAYRQWSEAQPRVPIEIAVEDAWKAETGNGPNRHVLSPSDEPKDGYAHCQLDDSRLTKLVVECLWTDFCMPYVQYKAIQTEKILLQDLRTLRPTAWLNDVVIASYSYILQSKSKDCVLVPRSSTMGDTDKPFKCDVVSAARTIKKASNTKGGHTIKRVLIPRNYDNFHWSLVAMELSNEDNNTVIISHYDSAFKRQISDSEEIKRLLIFAKEVLLIGDSATLDIKDINYKSIVPDRVPRQHNDYDCGVFVCIMAATLSGALHVPFSDINQAFVTDRNCRASICASILIDELVPPTSTYGRSRSIN